MNLMINSSRLLAAAACGFVLAGCNAVEDLREEPFTPVPTTPAVLEGTIAGLGRLRPVFLDDGISLTGHVREKSFAGSVGAPVVPFTFGAVPTGTPYNITVTNNPYGLICSVANGTGTVGTAADIAVTCVNDPAIVRYTVGGTVTAPAGTLPAGTQMILTTEDGVEELPLAAGQTSFTFARRVFNTPVANPPAYAWTVTARYTDANGVLNNCAVTGGTGSNSVANVTTVRLTACTFAVTGPGTGTNNGTVQYSVPPGGTVQAMGAGGLRLGLRSLGAAVPDAPDVTINAYSPTAVLTLWPAMRSFPLAVYDIVVVSKPAGQTCIVRTTNGPSGTVTMASQLWLVNASETTSSTFNRDSVSVRCRNNPALANQLTGTYQRTVRNTATPTAITDREYMSFFADGTFMFATHGIATGATGLEHGFYAYNAAAGTLDFTLFVDTSVTTRLDTAPINLSNTLGYTGAASSPAGGLARATGVVKTGSSPRQLSMTFTGVPTLPAGSPAGTPALPSTWASITLVEPKSVAGQMAGPWVSDDHRRMWIFNFDDTSGLYAGVNGPATVADGCFVFDDATAPSGYYTRRGGSTGCMTTGAGFASGFSTLDNLGGVTITPGTPTWRMPGTQNASDGRPPSPTLFQVTPGTAGAPDTLTAQGTVNGDPTGLPITTLRRSVIN